MTTRRQRSVFWVVSTHVSTTALITALGVIGAGLLSAMLQFFAWLSIPLALGAPIAILALKQAYSLIA